MDAMARTGRPREEGFTLIEMAIGALLLQVGLLGLASSFIVQTRAAQETRAANLRTMASRNIVEVLRSSPFDALVADYGKAGADTFWCDMDGNVSFASPGPYPEVLGAIELFDDINTIPTDFADLATIFDVADPPEKLYDELGVLPARVTLTIGADVTTIDVLLSRGAF